jgi:hypothetical protein
MEVGGSSGRQHWEKAVIAGVVDAKHPTWKSGVQSCFSFTLTHPHSRSVSAFLQTDPRGEAIQNL